MKIKILFISLLFMVAINSVSAVEVPEVTDHETVKLYMFWRDGCSACESAIEALNEIEEQYLDYFEIVTYDIYDGNNMDLLDYLETTLGGSSAVPYFVVGEQYLVGYNLDTLLEMIFEEYQNDDYVDFVGTYADYVGDYTAEGLEHACEVKGIDYWNAEETDHSADAYIVAGIFIILFGSIGYLVFSSKNK